MSSSFDLFDEPKVAATVSATNGASELYLIDRSFNEVSRGVGKLTLDLVPGAYRVRERVGDSESVSNPFQVAVGQRADFEALGVAYDSPLPIPGTATYQDLTQLQKLNREGPGVRIVVRDAQACDLTKAATDNSCLMEEVKRLRVESLTCETIVTLSQGRVVASSDGVYGVDLDLDPGSYALVQEGEGGRQICMALYIMPDWYPAVYFLLPRAAGAGGGPRCLRLPDASIFYTARTASTPPDHIELGRLEAARHALSRARPIGGWASLPSAHQLPVVNPLMALIDAHLLLSMQHGEAGGAVAALVAGAALAFGETFPDVQAARLALLRPQASYFEPDLQARAPAQSDNAVLPAGFMLDPLIGPPILSRSWRHLLSVYNARPNSVVALPFEFSVEPSESWFVWSEQAGARAPSSDSLIRKRLPHNKKAMELNRLARQIFEEVAASEESAAWVKELQRLFTNESGLTDNVFSDPAMQRIVGALVMVADPILQKTFAPGELVERAWATLNVPNEVLMATLRRFTGFLIKNKLLTGLSLVVGVTLVRRALAWLRLPRDGGGAT